MLRNERWICFSVYVVAGIVALAAQQEDHGVEKKLVKEESINSSIAFAKEDERAVQAVKVSPAATEKEILIEDREILHRKNTSTIEKETIEKKTPKSKEDKDDADLLAIENTSALLHELENLSCESEARSFGYQHLRDEIFHEIFCELNKLVHYTAIATNNLKAEFNLVLLFGDAQDTIFLNEPILSEILSEIITSRVVRLEEFMGNASDLASLLESMSDCIPMDDIKGTATKLRRAGKKLFAHVRDVLSYLELEGGNDAFVAQLKKKLMLAKREITSLFEGYASYSLKETADLFLTAASWIEMIFDNVKIYGQERLYVYLKVVEELINIGYSFYDGYTASELSRTVDDLLLSLERPCKTFLKLTGCLNEHWTGTNVTVDDTSVSSDQMVLNCLEECVSGSEGDAASTTSLPKQSIATRTPSPMYKSPVASEGLADSLSLLKESIGRQQDGKSMGFPFGAQAFANASLIPISIPIPPLRNAMPHPKATHTRQDDNSQLLSPLSFEPENIFHVAFQHPLAGEPTPGGSAAGSDTTVPPPSSPPRIPQLHDPAQDRAGLLKPYAPDERRDDDSLSPTGTGSSVTDEPRFKLLHSYTPYRTPADSYRQMQQQQQQPRTVHGND